MLIFKPLKTLQLSKFTSSFYFPSTHTRRKRFQMESWWPPRTTVSLLRPLSASTTTSTSSWWASWHRSGSSWTCRRRGNSTPPGGARGHPWAAARASGSTGDSGPPPVSRWRDSWARSGRGTQSPKAARTYTSSRQYSLKSARKR